MNNKKGFTLIELIVSVVLVSVVLVALIGSLLQLRNAYTIVHENSDVIVYTSSVSRVINSDINNNSGIKYISCEADGKKCSIILGNDERRELIITENDKTVDDVTDTAITHSNNKTTLKYMDTTSFDKTNNEDDKKLIYIRTLELDKYENSSSQTVTSSGHNFYDMSANQYEYFDPTNNYIDAFTTLTIRLLDGINMDLSKYNITLYGSGRYDNSNCGTFTQTRNCNTQECVCCPSGGYHYGNYCYTGDLGPSTDGECGSHGYYFTNGRCYTGAYLDSC